MHRVRQRATGGAASSARRARLIPALLVAVLALASGTLSSRVTDVSASTLPGGLTDTTVAGGLSSPTAMAFAPGGRIFVTEQGGTLRVIKNGGLLATPFLSVTVDSSGERGLLGVAFDPNFAATHYVYVYYTATAPSSHNRVSRFTANGDVAAAGSEVLLLDLNSLSSATNHNGGAIHFGIDGKLYIGVGDNANGANAQTLSNLLGKMLRINGDGTIPTDNPFYNTATGQNRAIWAMGLRNPFSFSVQPGTGRIFINDVGQSAWEEIDDGVAGSNYGWPATEGVTADPNYRSPLFAYGHGSSSTTGCAITGGAFYNPVTAQLPAAYTGTYFFADYCSGWIQRYDPVARTTSAFASGIASPVDLQVAPNGRLYYLARGTSSVGFISDATAPAATIASPANGATVSGSVAFSAEASDVVGVAKVRFWVDGTYLGYDSTAPYSKTWDTAAFQNGRHVLKVEALDRAGNGTIRTATVTLKNADSTPPTVTIAEPASGATVAGTISISATAADNLGLQKVRFWVDTTYLSYDTTAPYARPWDTTGFANGAHTIRVQAVDWLDNVSETTITTNVSN